MATGSGVAAHWACSRLVAALVPALQAARQNTATVLADRTPAGGPTGAAGPWRGPR
ncbi:hypothetical protein [Streptosporangium vulgare]|uniref:hypothetical protein n=1 Tax=Streptosporangium vulgare TaxID=46190 RepID=UPI0031DC4909